MATRITQICGCLGTHQREDFADFEIEIVQTFGRTAGNHSDFSEI